MFYAHQPCFGTREILSVDQEKQPNGRVFEKYNMGKYQWQTFGEIREVVDDVGSGLLAIGHTPGDNLVIFAETRADWMITALACFKHGFPIVTVYATLGEEAIAHALNQTESSTIVTSHELVPKVVKSLPHCQHVRRVVYFESLVPNVEPVTADTGRVKVTSFSEVKELGKEKQFEPEIEPQPSDIAFIMYTSGTTGMPKGVIITHANLVAGNAGEVSAIPGMGFGDIYIGYLPLAHVLEVGAELAAIFHGVCIGYSTPLTLTDNSSKIKKGTKGDARALKPTLMACVPAIMDRIYKAVMDKVTKSSKIRQALFFVMYERKRKKMEHGYDSPFLNRLVYSHIRAILGGQIRMMLSGGAPLNPETQKFMNICFCCPVGQGYGLTETMGAGTICDHEDLKTGVVGPPLPCNDIMLRNWEEGNYLTSNKPNPQGEVCISGANVTVGYYKNEEKTKEDFHEIKGRWWFCTGDIGEFLPDGNLKIIDRKKDLVKLSHGEYVSLAKVETRLSTNNLVDNICVYGNSLHPYLIALLVPSRKAVEGIAEKEGVKGEFPALCQSKKVNAAVLKDLQQHALKNNLEKFEVPQKLHICEEVWTPDMGLLTEAYKLKRRPIELKYKPVVDSLYE